MESRRGRQRFVSRGEATLCCTECCTENRRGSGGTRAARTLRTSKLPHSVAEIHPAPKLSLSVGRSRGHHLRAVHSVGPGTVVREYLLPSSLAHLLRDDGSKHIGRSAGSGGYDDPDGLARGALGA